MLIVFELMRNVLKRGFRLSNIEIWQELEQNKNIKKSLEDMIGVGGYGIASRHDTQGVLERFRHRGSQKDITP